MTQPPPRVMIVVSRHRPELFDYLTQTFSGMAEVAVVLDRRIASEDEAVVDENLRGQPDVYDDLDERGFIAVRLW